jgi:deoxyribodipyrimidine photo-lyase
LVEALAHEACCIVADDFPSFFLPSWVEGIAASLPVQAELVDSNGILPLSEPQKVFSAAYHFRRYLQKTLPEHLPEVPAAAPLEASLPGAEGGAHPVSPGIRERWPVTSRDVLHDRTRTLTSLSLDDGVAPVAYAGTTAAAEGALRSFVRYGLNRYADERNHPDAGVTSGLSPYLHFGAVSSQEVLQTVISTEGWSPLRLSERTDGARAGWWGRGEGAEAFLDQLITWRELGFNMACRQDDHTTYESLPEWARRTLEEHEGDPRPHLYTLEELQEARTHDPVWNAAQRQLLQDGIIHNYLRMLWGKKILEWSASPRAALEVMMYLNDRWAVDGRDPNSYSGIFWCLGRYDRGWPRRPVFGKVRSMSSDATRRKVQLDKYLQRYN